MNPVALDSIIDRVGETAREPTRENKKLRGGHWKGVSGGEGTGGPGVPGGRSRHIPTNRSNYETTFGKRTGRGSQGHHRLSSRKSPRVRSAHSSKKVVLDRREFQTPRGTPQFGRVRLGGTRRGKNGRVISKKRKKDSDRGDTILRAMKVRGGRGVGGKWGYLVGGARLWVWTMIQRNRTKNTIKKIRKREKTEGENSLPC